MEMIMKLFILLSCLLPFSILAKAFPTANIPSTTTRTAQMIDVSQETLSQKINLNTATIHQLTGSFKGIGKKRAQAIVQYRLAHHGFKSIDELALIKGLGKKFLQRNRQALYKIFKI